MEKLKLSKREKITSHQARKSRKNGNVPGIMYGKQMGNFLFEIGELELNSVISSTGEFALVNVEIDGVDKKALIKEVQRHPVNKNIIHLDLEEVNANKKITSSIPIKFIGEELIGKSGAVVQKERESIKVSCEPNEIPKSFEIDLRGGSVGSVYKIYDLEIAPEISVVDDITSVIASISYEQKIKEAID